MEFIGIVTALVCLALLGVFAIYEDARARDICKYCGQMRIMCNCIKFKKR